MVNWAGGEVRREGTGDRGLLGTCKIGQVGRGKEEDWGRRRGSYSR